MVLDIKFIYKNNIDWYRSSVTPSAHDPAAVYCSFV